MTRFLFDGPQDGPVLLLTHGSGAAMDTAFMNDISAMMAKNGVGVIRFEFEFMAQRRTTGKKRPPPKAEKLIGEFVETLDQVKADTVFIGGKSLGGRVASMMAQRLYDEKRIAGLVCLGYPFHPPGKPDVRRTAHFENYDCPTLICQGENDPFGKRIEIETYTLPDSFCFHWAPFGDHGMKPPKRSGFSEQQNLQAASDAIARFING
jgi:predicted alpha/beta-hydrolase family hydrolase